MQSIWVVSRGASSNRFNQRGRSTECYNYVRHLISKVDKMTNLTEPKVLRPLSPIFRAAAGLLFLLSLPTMYFQIQNMIFETFEFLVLGEFFLCLNMCLISGSVLFTGFAPKYFVNLAESESQSDGSRGT